MIRSVAFFLDMYRSGLSESIRICVLSVRSRSGEELPLVTNRFIAVVGSGQGPFDKISIRSRTASHSCCEVLGCVRIWFNCRKGIAERYQAQVYNIGTTAVAFVSLDYALTLWSFTDQHLASASVPFPGRVGMVCVRLIAISSSISRLT
jgi:hypothetical protein